MDGEIIQNEVTQILQDKPHMFSLMCGFYFIVFCFVHLA